MARKSKGRQKVEMVKMQNESNLQVTFSKRRLGLFKKASELCTLCGVEIAIIVFSPGKKVFSFGHPSVETLIDRFPMQNPPPNSVTLQLIEAHRKVIVHDLNAQLTQINNQMEHEKKRGEGLDKMRRDGQTGECWWECPLEELEKPHLEQLKVSLEELKNKVAKQTERILVETSNPNPPPPHYFHGNSSVQTSNPNPPPHYFHGNSSFQPGIIPYDSKVNVGYPLNPDTLLPHQHNLGYGRGFF